VEVCWERPTRACRATRAEVSHFIRRISDGVIAENHGKAREAGELRVTLFPSKHRGFACTGRRPGNPVTRSLRPNRRRPASNEEADIESESFLRRVRGHALALPLSPICLAHDDFMLSRQAMRCTSATPGDWTEDSA